MNKAKKFGTFAGVYTPSVLTILGVIMYMRLGWVVGQGGLWVAVAVILVAHIISVSTGLSISSIATDKKIKTGGIYYILSRSLGLPMGGAIGITLFLGTALSISLYLVGFAENFLSIPQIADFLHLENGKMGYQIVGSVMLLLLAILAFISTSLAIKTQFFVLAAIGLSLISIIVGFFLHGEYHPEAVLVAPSTEGIPIAVIFGVFFPAVTGFTAGVAMSGDLEDPKRSIPSGTMFSIVTGLVVYIGLAVAIAFFVNRDLLLNDINYLMKIAWIMPLVPLGIWGATLSSALGGILGGPRILQAISNDKIGPKIFGKGYGASKEPRIALIVIFVLAEVGILIGELNVIAEVVSMFYLAAYAFINIAFTLEKWASSDFRPSFKVPKLVGIIGFAATFIVMMQISMMYMMVALLVMGLVYFFLQRRQLSLERGDVWQSVRTSVVRDTLHRLDQQVLEERNWRPNVILFSGGTQVRPHLLEFGKEIVGNHGFLSNFDLYEEPNTTVLFPKHKQAQQPDETRDYKGIFMRRQSCSNIYQGMEMIARTYGFAGLEPNAVLLGWGPNSKHPIKFVQTIHKLNDLDLNVLLMSYDKQRGFGKFKRIDIWWRGRGNNSNLILSLVKFLQVSDKWRNAGIRLLIVNPINDERDKIYRDTRQIIDNLRMEVDIKVINNQIEQKPFFDIIKAKSVDTDLTFLGIKSTEQGKEHEFVDGINQLVSNIGTVVMVNASSYFRELKIGITSGSHMVETQTIIDSTEKHTALQLPKHNVVAVQITKLLAESDKRLSYFSNDSLNGIANYYQQLTGQTFKTLRTVFTKLQRNLSQAEASKHPLILARGHFAMLVSLRKIAVNFQNRNLEIQTDLLTAGLNNLLQTLDSKLEFLPEVLPIVIPDHDLEAQKNDSTLIRWFKYKQRFSRKLSQTPPEYNLRYKELVQHFYPSSQLLTVQKSIENIGLLGAQFIVGYGKLVQNAENQFVKIADSHVEARPLETAKALSSLDHELKRFEKLQSDGLNTLNETIQNQTVANIQHLAGVLSLLHPNNEIKRAGSVRKKQFNLRKNLVEAPDKWHKNQVLLFNSLSLQLMLSSFGKRVDESVLNTLAKTKELLKDSAFLFIEQLKSDLQQLKNTTESKIKISPHIANTDEFRSFFEQIKQSFAEALGKAADKFPETVTVMTEESFDNFSEKQYSDIDYLQIASKQLVNFFVQAEIIETVNELADHASTRMQSTLSACEDTYRLVGFTLGNQDSTNSETERLAFLAQEELKLNERIADLQAFGESFEVKLKEAAASVKEKLSVYVLTRQSGHLKQYIRKKDSRKRWNFIYKRWSPIRRSASWVADQFWYRRSSGSIMAKQLQEFSDKGKAQIGKLLDMTENIQPKPEVLAGIPLYYRKLFSGSAIGFNEFWVGRKYEIKQAEKTISRIDAGYKGGLAIIGDNGSGKTFFADFVAHRVQSEPHIYKVKPVPGGSADTRLFKKSLDAALGLSGKTQNMMQRLEQGSVIIIDDLEMWWERSPKGLAVVNKIIELINSHSHKLRFILTCNTHAFRLISRLNNLSGAFTGIVNCSPFNAEEIRDMILIRHRTSGFNFQLGKRKQAQFRSIDYAKLFAKYYSFSQGNALTALNAWPLHVKQFHKGQLEITSPKTPNTEMLYRLASEQYITLLQFVLHKELSVTRLKTVSNLTEEKAHIVIGELVRSGLITESTLSKNVFGINVFLRMPVIDVLKDKELL